MTQNTHTTDLITRTVTAIRADTDPTEAVRAIGDLITLCPPADVSEELGARVLAANKQRGTRPIETKNYLRDPAQCYALIEALETGDTARVQTLMCNDYPTLVTWLVCTLAVIQETVDHA